MLVWGLKLGMGMLFVIKIISMSTDSMTGQAVAGVERKGRGYQGVTPICGVSCVWLSQL